MANIEGIRNMLGGVDGGSPLRSSVGTDMNTDASGGFGLWLRSLGVSEKDLTADIRLAYYEMYMRTKPFRDSSPTAIGGPSTYYNIGREPGGQIGRP